MEDRLGLPPPPPPTTPPPTPTPPPTHLGGNPFMFILSESFITASSPGRGREGGKGRAWLTEGVQGAGIRALRVSEWGREVRGVRVRATRMLSCGWPPWHTCETHAHGLSWGREGVSARASRGEGEGEGETGVLIIVSLIYFCYLFYFYLLF